jgi:hypothetical protein
MEQMSMSKMEAIIMKPQSKQAAGKAFKCDIFGCEQAFKTKFSLKRHFKKHYVKKLKCKFCDKAFGLQQYLEEHEHTHTGEKPYACPSCPMTFRQRGKLSLHRNAMHAKKEVIFNKVEESDPIDAVQIGAEKGSITA